MTPSREPLRCVVCQARLPAMTRAEAMEKGAATEINSLTYYHCIGRHTPTDILKAVTGGVPRFTRAGALK